MANPSHRIPRTSIGGICDGGTSGYAIDKNTSDVKSEDENKSIPRAQQIHSLLPSHDLFSKMMEKFFPRKLKMKRVAS